MAFKGKLIGLSSNLSLSLSVWILHVLSMSTWVFSWLPPIVRLDGDSVLTIGMNGCLSL